MSRLPGKPATTRVLSPNRLQKRILLIPRIRGPRLWQEGHCGHKKVILSGVGESFPVVPIFSSRSQHPTLARRAPPALRNYRHNCLRSIQERHAPDSGIL